MENLKISLDHDIEGRYITDIATSRKTSSHVVVTLGNYGNADYVYESQNATDATPLFISISWCGCTLVHSPHGTFRDSGGEKKRGEFRFYSSHVCFVFGREKI